MLSPRVRTSLELDFRVMDWVWVSGWFGVGLMTIVSTWCALNLQGSGLVPAVGTMFIGLVVTTPMLVGISFASYLMGLNALAQALGAFALAFILALIVLIVVFFHTFASCSHRPTPCPRCGPETSTKR